MQEENTLDRLKALAEKEKHRQKRNQVPKRLAPTVSDKDLIVLDGLYFHLVKQEKQTLVIKANDEQPENVPVNPVQACSMAEATERVLSISGWDWRITRFKRPDKLTLKPIAPTQMVV